MEEIILQLPYWPWRGTITILASLMILGSLFMLIFLARELYHRFNLFRRLWVDAGDYLEADKNDQGHQNCITNYLKHFLVFLRKVSYVSKLVDKEYEGWTIRGGMRKWLTKSL